MTFGKSRCVYDDKEGTLFNGRRWWQDKNYNVIHTMNEYCAERLTEVDVPKATRSAVKKGASGTTPTNLERREFTLKEAVFTAATYLPENTSWQEVVRRRLFNADTGELITDWQDVKSLTTDQLHADLGDLVRLRIEYEIDLDLRSEGLKPLSEEQATQLRGTVARMSWAGRQGRPELAAPASMIASCFPVPTVAKAKSANAVVQLSLIHI